MWNKGIFFLLLIALMGAAFYYFEKEQQEYRPDVKFASIVEEDTAQVILPEPTLLYGIVIDSFDVFEGKVKWNQNLSEILYKFNISNESIYALANASKGVFDVRKLKAGKPYTIIHERDEGKTARQFIFEPDDTEYVVFNLSDTIYVQRIKRDIIKEEKVIVATIESSMYEALLDLGESPLLVDKLVDVFAWQVDPFRIQKGDQIKVIYEQERVGEKVVNIGKIKGAVFNHFGREYYAVLYDQEGKEGYYDENGNSLRKAFLKAPLNYSRISSRYNPRRYHPVLKTYKAHLGTDYAAPTGTEIRTVGDGVIVEAQYSKYNGNYVKVRHNGTYTTQYLHMSRIAKGIRAGVSVRQGQTIGYVGSSGLATGPHLCFRFWKNGKQVDALKVDLPPSEPIDPARRIDFLHAKNVILHRLMHVGGAPKTPVLAQIPVNTN